MITSLYNFIIAIFPNQAKSIFKEGESELAPILSLAFERFYIP
jgi:hypothetical protein